MSLTGCMPSTNQAGRGCNEMQKPYLEMESRHRNQLTLGAGFWSSARVVMPNGKTSVHLRLDSDVVEWFKANGKGHLTRMNAVLRAYVEAKKG